MDVLCFALVERPHIFTESESCIRASVTVFKFGYFQKSSFFAALKEVSHLPEVEHDQREWAWVEWSPPQLGTDHTEVLAKY